MLRQQQIGVTNDGRERIVDLVRCSGGQLTDVQFLQSPNDQPNSVRINQAAMPLLKQEAISTQSAKVDTISGATQSSGAFVQSLGDALAQAK